MKTPQRNSVKVTSGDVPQPHSVSLSTHHHSNWNQYAMGVRCFLHTGHKHGAHCLLCSTPSMHSCRWRWFVNIFESTPYSVMYKGRNSEIQPRASSLGLHVQEMKMSLHVCSQLIYSFSQTWMIPEGNQELQMFTPDHLSLPAARVHAVTELLLQSYTVMLQCVTTSWYRWALIHLSRPLSIFHSKGQENQQLTRTTMHQLCLIYTNTCCSAEIWCCSEPCHENEPIQAPGPEAELPLTAASDRASATSARRNLKKPHFNKKQSKIFKIKDPKTLRVLTSTNWTFFIQDLRFLNEKHCVDELWHLWRQGPELWILERSDRSRSVSV